MELKDLVRRSIDIPAGVGLTQAFAEVVLRARLPGESKLIPGGPGCDAIQRVPKQTQRRLPRPRQAWTDGPRV
jgi:hypothetical protein